MQHFEILNRCLEVLDAECTEPAEELIRTGRAIVGIGEVLKGHSLSEAQAIIKAVIELEQVRTRPRKNDGKP